MDKTDAGAAGTRKGVGRETSILLNVERREWITTIIELGLTKGHFYAELSAICKTIEKCVVKRCSISIAYKPGYHMYLNIHPITIPTNHKSRIQQNQRYYMRNPLTHSPNTNPSTHALPSLIPKSHPSHPHRPAASKAHTPNSPSHPQKV